ncbi:MAG TPA: copper chaperone PCu(A)C [Rhizomicrobium sp.]|nr:copper chaperone PCu(A)C [Rhizomicrobium sp.]
MHNSVRIALAVVLAAGFAASAHAADISVTNAWFRALPAGLPAGGYFSLHNGGTTPVELVGAKSLACGTLMLHQSTESGGMSRMNAVRSIKVDVGGTLAFAPGGYHLMCMNPSAAMAPGKQVSVTLLFADGAHVETAFAVKNAAGK